MDDYFNYMNINSSEKEKIKEAYARSHDIRKFEIQLFWQRGTYYWAFILAAFTAHFVLLKFLLLGNSKEGINASFSLKELCSLPSLSLFSLTVTSFFLLFFSFCWVLINKGSKFWQINWEEHIDMLQTQFSGDLYKTILDTTNTDLFSPCPLCLKAYDYSVTKITMLTSIVLMIVSFLIFVFHALIFIMKLLCINYTCFYSCKCCISFIVLLIAFTFLFFICRLTKGNKKDICLEKSKNKTSKWIKR